MQTNNKKSKYQSLGLPHVQLGRSIRYTVPDLVRWTLGRRSTPASEQEVDEMIKALGGANQLLNEKKVAEITGLSVATLQTDRCRSVRTEASQ